jgi:hypothetical protein
LQSEQQYSMPTWISDIIRRILIITSKCRPIKT